MRQLKESRPVPGVGVLHQVGPDDVALLRGGLGDVLRAADLLIPEAGARNEQEDGGSQMHYEPLTGQCRQTNL